MKEQAENRMRRPIIDRQDLEELDIFGVGCIVALINNRGQVFVVEETQKGCGIGLLGEKRKENEAIAENVRAALLEELGIRGEDLSDFLWDPKRSCLDRIVVPYYEDRRLRVDVVGVYYSGQKDRFRTGSVDQEVGQLGFVNPKLLRKSQELRPSMSPVLDLINKGDMIGRFIEAAQNGWMQPVFSEGSNGDFAIDDFVQKRAGLSDLARGTL